MKAATVAIALALAAPVGVLAQQPARPVFRSGAEIVRLDVRVLDENGRPIRDLRAAEIEVLEDGRSRPVLLFQHVEEPSGSYAEIARRTVAGEVSTNQGALRGHVYVLIFDQQHITGGNEQRARLAAERFLRTRLRPGDRVALYALPGPGPQIDFTGNVERAVGELPKVRGSLERMSPGALGAIRIHEAYEIGRGNQEILTRVVDRLATQQAATDTLGGFAGRSAASASAVGSGDRNLFEQLVKEDARGVATRANDAARRFLLMLSDVVRQLAPIEGRKTLVLFSEGFYSDHVTRELEQVAAAAAQSYSVIYALDLNKRETDLRESEPLGGDQQSEIDSRLGSLGSLAVETDGLLLKDVSANPGAALTKIADISRDYYVVGFEPTDGVKRGSYRRVRVRVTRPGARVSSRSGYALSDPAVTPADRRRAINIALGAPFPLQGLPIRYTTYVLGGGSPGAQKVFLSLAADLPVVPGAGDQRSADVVFLVRSLRDGRVVTSGTDVLPLPGAASGGASIATAAYKVQFEAPPGEYLMRVVVREPGGLVGSADRRFAVRRLDAPGVTASDLVLGGAAGSLPVRAIAYNGDALAGFVELYARRAEDLDAVTVSVDLAPIGGQAAATSVRAELGETKVRENGAVSRPAHVSLPLEGVAPGEYVARAVVRERGETIAELVREVQVLPGTAPATTEPAPTAPPTFTPADVLGGEIARRYVRALADAARGSALQPAADLASRGAWAGVEGALGPEPSAPDSMYFGLRGLARFALRRFDGAAADLDRAAGDPPAALASFLLGWVHESAGSRRAAIGAWRAAAHADPTLVSAHLAIAEAYLRISEPALAIQALKAGLTAMPASPELREKLSSLEHKR